MASAPAEPLPAVDAPPADSSGWMLTVAAVAMFSIATPMTKAALVAGVDPLGLLASRMTVGTLLLIAWLIARAPGKLKMAPRDAGLALMAGVANGVGMVAYFFALLRIDGSVATMIFACSPLCAIAILALRGERAPHGSGLRITLGLLGIWLIVGPSGRVDLLGALAVVLSAVLFAWHLAILQWNLSGADGRTTTLWIVIGMAIVAWAVWLLNGAQWHPLGPLGWTVSVTLAVVSTWGARLALFAAVRRIGSGQVSLLLPLETPMAVFWSVLFRGERLHGLEIAGGALIVLSAVLGALRRG